MLPTCNAEELHTVFGPVAAYWLEDKDPVEAAELLSHIIERNAPYFFDSANAARFKVAFKRIEKVVETFGGATSTNSSNTATSTET